MTRIRKDGKPQMDLEEYMKTAAWPQEDAGKAAKLWMDGKTGTQIANALDNRYTRCAVIGKMKRMGLLRNPSRPVDPKPAKVKIERAERVAILHKRGFNATAIAANGKIRRKEVVAILAGMGVEEEKPQPLRAVHPCWSMSEDNRRMYFYHKFMAGWAKVLERLAEKA